MKFKNIALIETAEWLPGPGEKRKRGEVGQRSQTSSYKMSISEAAMYSHSDYS